MRTSTSRLPSWARVVLLAVFYVRASAGAESIPPYASGLRFEDFAVPRESVAIPAVPRIEGREARLYRAEIRRAARKAPDFAGHLRVARWGCGTCCQQFAIVDLRTGKVSFPGFTVSCGANPRDPAQRDAGIFYRPDSGLFVVSGVRNEKAGAGIWYYRWSGGGLVPLNAGRSLSPSP